MSASLLDNPVLAAELATTAPAVASAPQVAGLLFDAGLTHAHGALLGLYIQFISEFLRTGQAATRADRLHLLNLRHVLTIRREAEELTANPTLRSEQTLAAARFARKAQSGFSGGPAVNRRSE